MQILSDVAAAVVALAGEQFGVVARRQLLRLGMTSSAIARWVRQGRLHVVHPGVYLLGHPVPPPFAREQAALLAAGGDDAVISHMSAARIDGFVDEHDGSQIHVTTSRFRGRPRGIVVHTSRRLPPEETVWRHGLPMTAPARTLIDVAEVAEGSVVERAVETAFAKRRVTEAQLRAAVRRHPGRRGARRLTAFLDSRGSSGFTRSWAEDRLRALLKPTHLPEPRTNVKVEGYEVDFHFVDAGVVVEVDSWRYHSGQAAFARDRRKWAHLELKGQRVVGVTAWEIQHEPEATIARIAAAVALASAR